MFARNLTWASAFEVADKRKLEAGRACDLATPTALILKAITNGRCNLREITV